MGDQGRIELGCGDCFLRHVAKKSAIKRGIVSLAAFKDQHPTLSFTLRDENLRADHGLRQYQLDKMLLSGDLPGICQLFFEDLTERLEPPLPPRHDPDWADSKYGSLHCVADPPHNDDHRREMAKLATERGVLLGFVKHKSKR